MENLGNVLSEMMEWLAFRSFRGHRASTLLAWWGWRTASSKTFLPLTVEELVEDANTNSSLRPVKDEPIFGASSLKATNCKPSRGVATISAAANGSLPSMRKDPASLLGAGWEGGGKDVAVAVWWDIENCNVPVGIEVYKVGLNIVSGLRTSGFEGPVSISAYGDILQLARSTQEALASTGIRLHHIPSGGKDSSDRALLVDLILWTLDHPPPAHLFLISGDRDFSNALHKLRMMNYNILLACPTGATASPALLGAATQVWLWNSLVRGEGLLSMWPTSDFRPPDGSSGGAALRQAAPKPNPSCSHDPLIAPDGAANLDQGAAVARPNSSVQGSKASEEARESPKKVKVSCPSSVSPLREPPKKILQQLHNLLISHPTGIMLTDLQKYISSEKVYFEKDFYGHGKIVPFLFSIPHLVRVKKVLMKDNRTWSYLLTSPAQSAGTTQQETNSTAHGTSSMKVATKQKTSNHALNSQETSSVAVSLVALEVGSTSPEQPTEISTGDRLISEPQAVVEEAWAKDSDRPANEVIQLKGEPHTPSQVGKVEQKDYLVDEKAPTAEPYSLLSSLISMLGWRRKNKTVDRR